MKCLKCAGEIMDSYLVEWAASSESRYGVFKCPHCNASHLRRASGATREGRPVYEFRLWGHPASTHRILKFEGVPKPTGT